MKRNKPTERDQFIALWMEETARCVVAHCPQCGPLADRTLSTHCKGQTTHGKPAARHHRLCDAVELMRRARGAQRHAVNLCNREVTDRETARDDKNDAAIRALCAKYGFAVEIGGDPRGYVVKVRFPSGAHNTLGGAESGWGVPT